MVGARLTILIDGQPRITDSVDLDVVRSLIEEIAEESVKEMLLDELKQGRLAFVDVNIIK